MIKKILILFIFQILSINSYASYRKAAKAVAEKQYFVASVYLKRGIGRTSGKKIASLMEKIVPKTGIYAFLDLSIKDLDKMGSSPVVNYVKAKKMFFLKKDKQAIKYFSKVSKGSNFYLQSLLNLASLYEINGKVSKAIKLAKKCVRVASRGGRVSPARVKRVSAAFRAYIHDTCEILIPRAYYKQGKIKKAVAHFKRIDSRSYQFPHLLFDSSWPYFRLKNYNRAVGRNLTFQAPILDNYFLPESEFVKAITYLRLCDYDETINIIKNFDKNVRKKLQNFQKSFDLKTNRSFPFLDYMKTRKKKKKKFKKDFISKMYDVLAMKPGIKILEYHYKILKKEEKKTNLSDKRAFKSAKADFVKFYNMYIKVKFVGYAKEIIRVSNIMSEMELDIYTFLKNELYDKKNKKKKRRRSSKELVYNYKRKRNQHIYNFAGEFWADELGNYIPLLESSCKGKKSAF